MLEIIKFSLGVCPLKANIYTIVVSNFKAWIIIKIMFFNHLNYFFDKWLKFIINIYPYGLDMLIRTFFKITSQNSHL